MRGCQSWLDAHGVHSRFPRDGSGVAPCQDHATVWLMETWSPIESGVLYRSMEEDDIGRPKVGDAAYQLGVRTGLAGKGTDFARPTDSVSPNGEGLSVVPHSLDNYGKLFRTAPAIVPRKLFDWGLSVLPVYEIDIKRLPEPLQAVVRPRPVDRKKPEGEKVDKGIVQARRPMPIHLYQLEIAKTQNDWKRVL